MNRHMLVNTKFWLGELEGISLGRLKCRYENNIKKDFREIRCKGVDWIQLAQDNLQLL
jgi:hypothetical protein